MDYEFDALSYEELADLVIKLVYEGNAKDRRITELECFLSDADETMLAIDIELQRNDLARAIDGSLARHGN
jgi:hypothetical protein